MKIGISCSGENLDCQLDERFGRSPKFIIYDLENDSHTCIDNIQNLNSPQGAGIQTAQNLINAGVDIVITGNVGPKAYRTLDAGGVEVYLATGLKVRDAIDRFKRGMLTKAETSNVEGHWV